VRARTHRVGDSKRARIPAARRRSLKLFGGHGPAVRNPEDDLDLALRGPGCAQYLDLMELVILPKQARGGHAAGASVYAPRVMADRVYKLVAQKSKRYGRPTRQVHLLLYSTDWRFHLI
jgi:hypothetical protein